MFHLVPYQFHHKQESHSPTSHPFRFYLSSEVWSLKPNHLHMDFQHHWLWLLSFWNMTKPWRVATSRQWWIIYEVSKWLVSGVVNNSLELFGYYHSDLVQILMYHTYSMPRTPWCLRRDSLQREWSLASAKHIQLQILQYHKLKQIQLTINKWQEMESINTFAWRWIATGLGLLAALQ